MPTEPGYYAAEIGYVNIRHYSMIQVVNMEGTLRWRYVNERLLHFMGSPPARCTGVYKKLEL